MAITLLTGALALGCAGVAAGVAARLLLGRLRRGARVTTAACALPIGTLWAVTGAAVGAGLLPGRWLAALLGLGWLTIAAGVVDLRHHRLPDALTLPALVLAPVAVVPLGAAAVERGLLAGTAGFALHAALHVVAPGAMGAGDVKLAGSLATVLGAAAWSAPVLAAVLAALLTGLHAVGLGARDGVRAVRAGRAAGRTAPRYRACGPVGVGALRAVRGGVPHGPSMLVAAWVVTAAVSISAPGR